MDAVITTTRRAKQLETHFNAITNNNGSFVSRGSSAMTWLSHRFTCETSYRTHVSVYWKGWRTTQTISSARRKARAYDGKRARMYSGFATIKNKNIICPLVSDRRLVASRLLSYPMMEAHFSFDHGAGSKHSSTLRSSYSSQGIVLGWTSLHRADQRTCASCRSSNDDRGGHHVSLSSKTVVTSRKR